MRNFRLQAPGEVSDPHVRAANTGNFTAIVDALTGVLDLGEASDTVRNHIEPRIAAWNFVVIGFTFDLIHDLGPDRFGLVAFPAAKERRKRTPP